jgi:hypothetical protein
MLEKTVGFWVLVFYFLIINAEEVSSPQGWKNNFFP